MELYEPRLLNLVSYIPFLTECNSIFENFYTRVYLFTEVNILDEVLVQAEKSASVTHNHPEGIKGAQAVASVIFLARTGNNKNAIREYIESTFEYDLS